MKNLFIIVFFIIQLGIVIFSELRAESFSNVGHAGANFLQIPAEPVGAALGNSIVASSRGVDGLYWNPGAITNSQGTEILLSTADWIIDTRLSFLGIIHNFGNYGTFGLSLMAFTMDKMEITTELEPNGTGEYFTAGSYCFSGTYGLKLTDRFSFGGSMKYIYEQIWETHGSGISFDFGSIYQADFYNLRIGMRLANFGGSIKFEGDPIDNKSEYVQEYSEIYTSDPRLERISEKYSLPQQYQIGIAIDPIHSSENRLTLLYSFNDPIDNKRQYNVGSEFAFKEFFFLRAGYKFEYEEQNLSAGLGFRFTLSGVKPQLDYAFNNFGILGSIHFMSLRIGF